MLQVTNPYGAVPEALKETRLSLRDVMSDYLNTKVEENKLRLGEARLGVEKAGIENQMQLNKLANDRWISQQQQQESQFQQTYGLQEQQLGVAKGHLAETTRHATAAEGLQSRGLDQQAEHNRAMERTAAGHLALAAKETAPVKWSVLAQQTGIDPRILPMLGIDPEGITTRSDARKFHDSYSGFVVPLTMKVMQGDLKDLKSAYDTTSDPEQKKAILAGFNRKLQSFQVLDAFAKNQVPEKDLIKIHSEMLEKGATTKPYSEWAQDYRTSQTKTSAAVAELSKIYDKMNAGGGTKSATVDEYNAKVRELSSFDFSPGQSSVIKTNLQKFVKNGDFLKAVEFIDRIKTTGTPKRAAETGNVSDQNTWLP